MNEGRGQDVAIAPFLKQSSNSAYSVPVPVVASTVSLGLPLPQGPEGTCVHVLNPPPLQDTVASSMWFSGYSVGMSPAESLPSCEGCLAWTIQAHKSAHNSMGWVLKPCYGHSQWPQDFPCMKEVWGHKLPKRNILADMRAMAFALCMVHKQQWMSSLSSCDHRLRLIEKLSFLTQIPLDSDSLSGEDNKRYKGCREPQHCMSVLAGPGCGLTMVLWGVVEALAMRRQGYTFGVNLPFPFWHLGAALGSCPCLPALRRQLITAERSVQPFLCWVV